MALKMVQLRYFGHMYVYSGYALKQNTEKLKHLWLVLSLV